MPSRALSASQAATHEAPHLQGTPAMPAASARTPVNVFTNDALRRSRHAEVYDFVASRPTVEGIADALTASLFQQAAGAGDYFFNLMDCLEDSPRLDDVWAALMNVVVETRLTLLRISPTYCDHELLHACGPTTPFVALPWALLEGMLDHAIGTFTWEVPASPMQVATTAALATTFLVTALDATVEHFGGGQGGGES